jgi:hypothetical protein
VRQSLHGVERVRGQVRRAEIDALQFVAGLAKYAVKIGIRQRRAKFDLKIG